ncbi:type II toxin-antitoxin system RelE/ParE family toxin [Rhodoplanes sp. TEM]|uniref:Type II toxin-antitoxin system RelE/ParE family toxin n=1 Tax=Rhodoplanes tepidamans TaxID=200616 RepID=A0ABT5J5K5_RHOTP|nr:MULTISPECIES: type II toxin-antitoxin system RelE/ParE family toxin [Rhodoplanes]MDC7784900.1 type II toxin-antitoxin system RelE/ParE family toxin [Rhodoplanes tepidamans]MDC7984004.1 type II toxin-antitoxin system RelE/ParE family toxin [Rhodoplanes sp. TEM]MDQ0353871.1 plasmid stabilization system protein ParE [Rhodoplanes tepidamans]
MRLELSHAAAAELDELLGYIGERSPSGAAHVEASLRQAFDRIRRHPEAAERVDERPSIRRIPLVRYPYVIYYEVGEDVVTILRILHGARRQPRPGEESES